MQEYDIERLARMTIAERTNPPREVPRRLRRQTIVARLRRTDTRPTN